MGRRSRWARVRACVHARVRASDAYCVPATHTLPIYTGTWLHTIAGATRRARVVRTLAEPAPARACMTRVLRRRRLRRHADETEGRPNPAHRRDVALTATTTRSAVPTVRTLAGWGATAQPWCRCGRVQLPFARSDQQPGERELPKDDAGVRSPFALGLGHPDFLEKGNGWEFGERRLRVVGVMSRASPERQRNLPSRERKVRRAPASRARSAAVEETRRWPQVYLAARVRPFSRREHSIEACSFSPCSGRAYLGLQTAPGVQAETCAYVEESTTTLVQTSTGEGTSR